MAHFLIFMLFWIQPLFAKDFGINGQTYPINEENLIDYLHRITAGLSDSDRGALQQKMQEYYAQKLQTPNPVPGIKNAESYHVHYFDPTLRLNQDIKDHEGRIIASKGSTYNILQQMNLSQTLLFFDGDNFDHLQWAQQEQGAWILVKGRPIDLETKQQKRIFFDQGGVLCQKLGITYIPARVTQEGSNLKIEQIPLRNSN